ncbi:cobaltochelatase subunit CobN [Pectinatus frisingensis]|uniref:cobaltochelatase subunit CobN n=1 Tax=Pectinatus frisingensis TaxID=865 RepID=UPI0018C7C526|nr:cobaltochelatase subunit CobN [Pectinatus frisingensis]
MKTVLFCTNITRQIVMMRETMHELQQNGALDKSCQCIWIDENTAWSDECTNILSDVDFLLIKWMGTGLDTDFMNKCAAYAEKYKLPHYIDAGDNQVRTEALSEKQILQIKKYFLYGGQQNNKNLWLYVNKCIDASGIPASEPELLYWCGIFHPAADAVYTSLEEYKRGFYHEGWPTIGVIFYREEWIWKDLAYQTALIKEIEQRNMNVVCVFSNGLPDETMGAPSLEQVFTSFFSSNGMPVIDVLINTMKFSLTSSSSVTINYLKKWNVPILQAYTLMTEYKEWENNIEGMNDMEVSISISLPEFDGVLHGLPIAAKKMRKDNSYWYKPIGERITKIVEKASKWAILRHKNNNDKKIAIIFHNYPPSNSNIGSAVGLDSIESIRLLLAAMRQCGYKVDHIPPDGKSFIDELTASATNDKKMLTQYQLDRAEKLTEKQYRQFFDTFTDKVQQQMHKDWGTPPGSVMEYKYNIIVPGTMNGNVFITVQPSRGFGEDPDKIYHSPFTVPTHHYLAFYKWLRDVWKADAVAHIGTHGSLEWLPGKNAGLSENCYPDLALGNLPNVYPYLITITGEGVQAKRRGSACLIAHLPAPQSQAGVYDELAELEKLMDEYISFQHADNPNLVQAEKLIIEKVSAADLQNEVIRDENRPFSEYVAALHNYLTDLKNMQVHTGLHVLGQAPQKDGLVEYLWLLTRLSNGTVPSLPETIAQYYKLDYHSLLKNSSEMYKPLNITYGILVDRITEQCRQIIRLLQANDFDEAKITEISTLAWINDGSDADRKSILQVCKYICGEIYPHLLLTVQEQDNMLRAFDGQYIEPGPSGAPSSGGADLLPTGRNFYGIDPRTLPTPAAWEVGKKLGDQAINRFIEEEQHYPENIGIVLWAGANMRSHGQCIAEFLYLLGIKPRWQRGSLRVVGMDVIPVEELQRPRIDVTARISGLFRDSIPSAIQLLDDAVLLAASLDEEPEQNFVKKHVNEDALALQSEGLNDDEAWRQAAFRIFGDEPGTYGAGVGALLEAKNWDSIDDIADVYVRWGAHAYGGEAKGKYLPQQFRKRLGSLDITIKNEDNHEVNMLSSDDYNAYHGGMIAAVRSIKGAAPRSYCGDSTDRSQVTMHSVQEDTKRLFRSEAINPKFINGMMKHGYKGAADMANYVAHSFQWDATSDVMEDWMYEKYAEKYAFDGKVQQWMRDVNPWALQRLTSVLLEANQRGLWNAKAETLDKLRHLYLSIEGEMEDRTDAGE